MRVHTPARYAALALLLGGLACAGNKANDDGTVVATDSTQAQDTSAYKGGERDTTSVPLPSPVDTTQAAPAPAPTPADTTQYQPSATPTDTTGGYQPTTPTDTAAPAPAPTDSGTSSMQPDTSGMSHDSTSAQ
ncbi:MAG TPA: hypothetical protein VIG08_09185 [Gemmatimonadales bacterium]|jgi:hypothetical protein